MQDNITYFWGVQEHVGALNFTTDTWTSPNHKAYVAMTVHFENAGVPVSMLMDIIEVVCSHSGFNLAVAFAKILEEYGIRDKVNIFFIEIGHDELTRHAQILHQETPNLALAVFGYLWLSLSCFRGIRLGLKIWKNVEKS